PLFTRIIADQFNRLRAGDRFFYLNESWNADELAILRQGNTLGKIIEANTGVSNLQNDVFKFTASVNGAVTSPAGGRHGTSGVQGLPGVTVQLEDSSGNVLATTVTDRLGRYRFTQLTGLGGTGVYTVAIVVPSGFTQTSTNPAPITISSGDDNMSGVNF